MAVLEYKFEGEPLIRLGLVEGESNVELKVAGPFTLLNGAGQPIFQKTQSDLRWRVKATECEPAQFRYAFILGQFKDKEQANKIVQIISNKGLGVRVEAKKSSVQINDRCCRKNNYYEIKIGNWNTRKDAQKQSFRLRDEFDPILIQEKVSEPKGKIEFYDTEYQKSVGSSNTLWLIPEENGTITFFDIRFNRNTPQERKESFKSIGKFEFQVDQDGKLAIIDILPIEEYLKGILPTLLPEDSPIEALKAQVVILRSSTLANLGLLNSDKYYDYNCFNQRLDFQRIVKSDKKDKIYEAVESTRGEVLTFNNQICRSSFSLVCGGRTDYYSGIWEQNYEPFMEGIIDTNKENAAVYHPIIEDEESAREWFHSWPKVYCNPFEKNFPGDLNIRVSQFFRWERVYSRSKLESIINRKLQEDAGTIYNIIPLKRGKSGKIYELEILGSRKNIVLKHDRSIRSILCEDELPSSNFTVSIETEEDGTPIEFTFSGAGHGEGVGLCQAGALVMAQNGAKYNKILDHYFRKTIIEKIYE